MLGRTPEASRHFPLDNKKQHIQIQTTKQKSERETWIAGAGAIQSGRDEKMLTIVTFSFYRHGITIHFGS
jgi:hypothetical protein